MHHCKTYLQAALRQVIKDPNISSAEKQDLMKKVQALK